MSRANGLGPEPHRLSKKEVRQVRREKLQQIDDELHALTRHSRHSDVFEPSRFTGDLSFAMHDGLIRTDRSGVYLG